MNDTAIYAKLKVTFVYHVHFAIVNSQIFPRIIGGGVYHVDKSNRRKKIE